jgi:hypothetical protein
VTLVDQITSTGAAIGSILTTVLLLSKKVLPVKLWKGKLIMKLEKQEKKRKLEFMSNQIIVESKSQLQSIVKVSKLSKWNNDNLINKKVISCENIYIGYISAIGNQLMTIKRDGGRQEEYIIPTYYVREYDEERVLIDTSIRYLDRYLV